MNTKEEAGALVDRYISSLEFPAAPERLYAPIAYSLEGGGKRLRPMIVVMACDLFSDDAERSLPCAAAVEMFHTFTLLHDDIMDNADIRRGRPTVHRRWNRNTAILSGDAMLICAYRLMQQSPPGLLMPLMSEFNKLAIEVCEGQQYDVDFESRGDVSIGEYMDMIRLKTAALIAGAARIGAICGGASGEDCDTMYRFGLELGFAFQLQDDYLDTYGTELTLGKKIGGDIAEGKKTILMVSALRMADDASRRNMLAAFRDGSSPLEQKIDRVRAIYDSLGIPAVTLAAIESHLGNAAEALGRLSVDPLRTKPLRELLETLRNRNK